MSRLPDQPQSPFVALWGAMSVPDSAPLLELPGWWSRRGAGEEARIVVAESGRDAGRGAVVLRRLRLAR